MVHCLVSCPAEIHCLSFYPVRRQIFKVGGRLSFIPGNITTRDDSRLGAVSIHFLLHLSVISHLLVTGDTLLVANKQLWEI